MDTKTATVETTTQAQILMDVQSASDRYRRVLAELRSRADRELTLLDGGFQPQGISHQTLNEVVRYESEVQVLTRAAVYAGITSEHLRAVMDTPEYVLIRHNDEQE